MKLFLASAIVAGAFVLGGVSASRANDSPVSAPSPCGELDCRSNGLPFVTDSGGITILPGEAFSVELKIEGGKITGVVPRKNASDLPNSLDFDFNSGGGGRMLSTKNHTDQMVKFDAFIKLPDGRLVATSSCPIMAKIGSFEMWSDDISYLELRNFRFLGASDAMMCN